MQFLHETAHRPWPLPRGPWVMRQTWHDLLFAHWPIDVASMRRLVPSELEIDAFGGSAWIGVVPFRMSGVRVRWLPPIPSVHAFPELNLRTYVRHRGVPGVWFFTLEATSRLAVRVARSWFHLPYHDAAMSLANFGERVEYRSERTHRGAATASFVASYEPSGPVERSRTGSLEEWLTERYCLFARRPDGVVLRGDIHHAPWPLQPARAEITRDTLPAAHGIALPDVAPHLAFARRIDVAIWAPRRA